MSFGPSGALQAAVYGVLSGDVALAAIVGGAVHDEPPVGPVAGTWVSLGEGEVRDVSDQSGGLGEHRFTVTVVTDDEGFASAKAAAAAVADALDGATPAMSRGRIVAMGFVRARVRRVRAAQMRRIDMTFRAIVEDD